MTDLFGHMGYALILIGLVLVGRGSKVGWIFRLIGGMTWVVIGFAIGMTSIWIWGLIFAALDYYNYIKWHNEQTS